MTTSGWKQSGWGRRRPWGAVSSRRGLGERKAASPHRLRPRTWPLRGARRRLTDTARSRPASPKPRPQRPRSRNPPPTVRPLPRSPAPDGRAPNVPPGRGISLRIGRATAGPAPSQGRGCTFDTAQPVGAALPAARGPVGPEAAEGAGSAARRGWYPRRLEPAAAWCLCAGLAMGLLSGAARALVRGADRMSKWTSKRGPRTFYKSRGAKGVGFHGRGGRFVLVKEMVPELVVPELAGFKLKPYVNYRAPEGTDVPLTAKQLFLETAAPAIEKDFKAGTFDPEHLEQYGFEPTQEGKLFQLYPKNFPR